MDEGDGNVSPTLSGNILKQGRWIRKYHQIYGATPIRATNSIFYPFKGPVLLYWKKWTRYQNRGFWVTEFDNRISILILLRFDSKNSNLASRSVPISFKWRNCAWYRNMVFLGCRCRKVNQILNLSPIWATKSKFDSFKWANVTRNWENETKFRSKGFLYRKVRKFNQIFYSTPIGAISLTSLFKGAYLVLSKKVNKVSKDNFFFWIGDTENSVFSVRYWV